MSRHTGVKDQENRLFADNESFNASFENYFGSAAHRLVEREDPLNYKTFESKILTFNERGDVGGLIDVLQRMRASATDNLASSEAWSYARAAAVMRDIGLVLGSIRRHGVQPLHEAPELEPLLVWLGRRTQLPPRDTLLHYTVWNPPAQPRTYTRLPEEIELINAVRLAFPALERAVCRLVELFEIPLDSPDFTHEADRIRQDVSTVRDAAIHTFKFVDRGVFIRSIRPYFEPIDIAGREYLGPGAVAMPLFVFDHIFWSAGTSEPGYVQFKEDYLPTTLPYLRKLYDRFSEEGCLVDRLAALHRLGHLPRTPQAASGLRALERILALTQRFRSVHLRMAEQAYIHTVGDFEKGSGGYSPTMLTHIFNLAAGAQKRLKQIAGEMDPSAGGIR